MNYSKKHDLEITILILFLTGLCVVASADGVIKEEDIRTLQKGGAAASDLSGKPHSFDDAMEGLAETTAADAVIKQHTTPPTGNPQSAPPMTHEQQTQNLQDHIKDFENMRDDRTQRGESEAASDFQKDIDRAKEDLQNLRNEQIRSNEPLNQGGSGSPQEQSSHSESSNPAQGGGSSGGMGGMCNDHH